MKRIGLVVAVELEAFYRRYGSASAVLPCRGYDVLEYNIGGQKVYIAECGAGEIGAAAATQLLISKFVVDFILNFGVVGGLTDKPVIAVPTSVGYGAAFHGVTALLAMLSSCASGVSVVNIDNGFGAGVLASKINHLR